jgi:hypothetical protein
MQDGNKSQFATQTLALHKICDFYFLFFMLPPEAHRESAADLVELHYLRSS